MEFGVRLSVCQDVACAGASSDVASYLSNLQLLANLNISTCGVYTSMSYSQMCEHGARKMRVSGWKWLYCVICFLCVRTGLDVGQNVNKGRPQTNLEQNCSFSRLSRKSAVRHRATVLRHSTRHTYIVWCNPVVHLCHKVFLNDV